MTKSNSCPTVRRQSSQLMAAASAAGSVWTWLLVLALVRSGLGDALLARVGDRGDVIGNSFGDVTGNSFGDVRGNVIPDGFIEEPALPAFKQHVRTKPLILRDPVFDELLDVDNRNNSKRASWDFYNMIKCGTGCNPLVYKGYGCYCGFLGSGDTVDGIDMCCKMHDWCYTTTSCETLEYNLPYFVPYKWSCNGGAPYCIAGKTKANGPGSCSHQLCECDREFVHCLADFPCPYKKAMCRSPWRYWQNLFMGLGTGMPMDDSHYAELHRNRPRKQQPQP